MAAPSLFPAPTLSLLLAFFLEGIEHLLEEAGRLQRVQEIVAGSILVGEVLSLFERPLRSSSFLLLLLLLF